MKIRRLSIVLLILFTLVTYGCRKEQEVPEEADIAVIDGEDAGSTPWEFDSIVEGGGATFSLDSLAALHGSYGYKGVFNNNACYGEKVLAGAGEDDLYTRLYLKVQSWSQSDSAYTKIPICVDGTTELIYFYIQYHATPQSFGIYAVGKRIGGTFTICDVRGDDLINLGALHFLEVRYKGKDAITGGAELWLDGVSLGSDYTRDTSGYATNKVRIGVNYVTATPSGVIYFDDILLSTIPIGEYSSNGAVAKSIASKGLITPSWYNLTKKR